MSEFDAFISPSVLDEASRGNPEAARKRLLALRDFPVLEMTPEVEDLAERYLKCGIVPDPKTYDMFHLAFAVAHRLDILVTWNFKHLANVFIYKRLAKYNQRHGLHTPIVCTPEELLGE